MEILILYYAFSALFMYGAIHEYNCNENILTYRRGLIALIDALFLGWLLFPIYLGIFIEQKRYEQKR